MYHERESLSIGGAGGRVLLSKPSFYRESMTKMLWESFHYEAIFSAKEALSERRHCRETGVLLGEECWPVASRTGLLLPLVHGDLQHALQAGTDLLGRLQGDKACVETRLLQSAGHGLEESQLCIA